MKKILFVGLGRIGLPQAVVFASKQFDVFGYDIDSKLINELKQGNLTFYEPELKEYLVESLNKSFHVLDNNEDEISNVDYVIISVGSKVPDDINDLVKFGIPFEEITSLLDELQISNLKKGATLIFRTTLPLGTTDKIRDYLKLNFNMVEGENYHLAFVPERLMEGQAIFDELKQPKIIGVYNDDSYAKVKELFEAFECKLIRVSSPKAAEYCKLVDNSYRSTRFSFSNDLAINAAENNLDAIELINAVNSGYDRNQIPVPGFVSGYCLGKDPYIFENSFLNTSEERGFHSLWYYGRRVNDYLTDYVVKNVVKKSEISLRKQIQNIKIAVLGLSFKEDVDDFRLSHSMSILGKLTDAGFRRFNLYDPAMESGQYTQLPENIKKNSDVVCSQITDELFEGVDILLILHRHKRIAELNNENTIEKILGLANSPLFVYDCWNIMRKVTEYDVIYESIGYRNEKF